jgi:hypothetical protein
MSDHPKNKKKDYMLYPFVFGKEYPGLFDHNKKGKPLQLKLQSTGD